MNIGFLQDLLNSVAEQGRHLVDRARGQGAARLDRMPLAELARLLLSSRGEASGVAIAREIVTRYATLPPEDRRAFLGNLASDFAADPDAIRRAFAAFDAVPNAASHAALLAAVEPPRQEVIRRLNLAPGNTIGLVRMREDLLDALDKEPALRALDTDFAHLFSSWFNRGFLVLRRIDWSSPAHILEKIIRYEAVHAIESWDDLRRRIDPEDRRCFAFFHPALVDEPLIFVEVALTAEKPAAIEPILAEKRDILSGDQRQVAVFYSISNCQRGLAGISFGNFLIKQVVEDLAREQPGLKTFVTLSPVPQFARWLDRAVADEGVHAVTSQDRVALQMLTDPGWIDDPEEADALKPVLMSLAAHYFLMARSHDGRAVDPVARFHLGNGARLERINWLGDVSEKGLREGHGLMVNYLYDLKDIERNHEAYANDGEIVASRTVRALLRSAGKGRGKTHEPALAITQKPQVGKKADSRD
jgi:malonyl-CoA decarboxylase